MRFMGTARTVGAAVPKRLKTAAPFEVPTEGSRRGRGEVDEKGEGGAA